MHVHMLACVHRYKNTHTRTHPYTLTPIHRSLHTQRNNKQQNKKKPSSLTVCIKKIIRHENQLWEPPTADSILFTCGMDLKMTSK